MAAVLKLLGRSTSNNVQKVLWLLDEIGRPYERADYGGAHGGTTDETYLRLNPNSTIPTLIDGDFVVWESNTILRYVAESSGAESFYPRDLKPRSICNQWMDWQNSTLGPTMSLLYKAVVRTEAAKRDPAVIDPLREKAGRLFAIMDGALDCSPFLAGHSMSLADIAVGSLVYRWYTLRLNDPKTQALEAWLRALETRPAFRQHVMIELV
jgi:glutathione S-transferase